MRHLCVGISCNTTGPLGTPVWPPVLTSSALPAGRSKAPVILFRLLLRRTRAGFGEYWVRKARRRPCVHTGASESRTVVTVAGHRVCTVPSKLLEHCAGVLLSHWTFHLKYFLLSIFYLIPILFPFLFIHDHSILSKFSLSLSFIFFVISPSFHPIFPHQLPLKTSCTFILLSITLRL